MLCDFSENVYTTYSRLHCSKFLVERIFGEAELRYLLQKFRYCRLITLQLPAITPCSAISTNSVTTYFPLKAGVEFTCFK